MHSSAVLVIVLVCVLPFIAAYPQHGCVGCTLENGTCEVFGSRWTEADGPGCFEKECIRMGTNGWRTILRSAKCHTDVGTCVGPGEEWKSRENGACYKNKCLSNGPMGVKVQIMQIAC